MAAATYLPAAICRKATCIVVNGCSSGGYGTYLRQGVAEVVQNYLGCVTTAGNRAPLAIKTGPADWWLGRVLGTSRGIALNSVLSSVLVRSGQVGYTHETGQTSPEIVS